MCQSCRVKHDIVGALYMIGDTITNHPGQLTIQELKNIIYSLNFLLAKIYEDQARVMNNLRKITNLDFNSVLSRYCNSHHFVNKVSSSQSTSLLQFLYLRGASSKFGQNPSVWEETLSEGLKLHFVNKVSSSQSASLLQFLYLRLKILNMTFNILDLEHIKSKRRNYSKRCIVTFKNVKKNWN